MTRVGRLYDWREGFDNHCPFESQRLLVYNDPCHTIEVRANLTIQYNRGDGYGDIE